MPPRRPDRSPERPPGRRLAGVALVALAALLAAGAGADGADRPAVRASPQSPPGAGAGALRAEGRSFVDPSGAAVILRGVNLTGNAKVPPFRHGVGPAELDRLRDLGMNVIRLLLIWEAYEPAPGCYDEAYLGSIRAIADLAWERGIRTIVDVHQDGFSRFASRGSGDGFPAWAVSGRRSEPDNGPGARYWPVLMATDPTTYRSFRDFFADAAGVRSRYLAMLGRVAAACASAPGVIGYDPLNEPWGDERRDLAPLYRDAAAAIRARHPGAILFLEGHLTTNTGVQSKLDRPDFGNVAYAPHYYKPSTIALRRWDGGTRAIDRAFAAMEAKSREWGCPLLVGEYGAGATIVDAGGYVAALGDRLDAALASGAQWNYTPLWNERDKDGWNAEDFNILDPAGRPRPNFRPRAYPRRVAGVPLRFATGGGGDPAAGACLDLEWLHRPELGATEVFAPASDFPAGGVAVAASPGVTWTHDAARQVLSCRAATPGPCRVRVTSHGRRP